ncbi:hypothetical protein RND81_10G064400 [Saponaria officinalis]|uniref:No apical meristem-associated C-terminal domain-containing protein n=1 Tax=Saponaria officinalis TaxID=3572 RepID=A0AAW1I1D8_SAPOF
MNPYNNNNHNNMNPNTNNNMNPTTNNNMNPTYMNPNLNNNIHPSNIHPNLNNNMNHSHMNRNDMNHNINYSHYNPSQDPSQMLPPNNSSSYNYPSYNPNYTYSQPIRPIATSFSPYLQPVYQARDPPQTPPSIHNSNDIEVEVDTGNEITPTSNASRGNQWPVVEDEALISSFMRVSEDSIVGTDQAKEAFWNRVKSFYDEAQEANPGVLKKRTRAMLDGRFRRISTQVMKWSSCMEVASRRKGSGMSEDDVIADARKLYKPGKFALEHAWNIMKNYEKWKIAISPYSNESYESTPSRVSDNDGSNSSGKRVRIEGEDMATKRPEGVKVAKRNRGKKKVDGSTFGDDSNNQDEINKRLEMINQTTAREHDIQQRRLEIDEARIQLYRERMEFTKRREARMKKESDFNALQQLLNQTHLPPELEDYKQELLQSFKRH